jgi:hypothetical protein
MFLQVAPMTLQQRLAVLVDDQLKPSGFSRRRFNWFSYGSDLYRVCNLQKSAWGDGGCYINLGLSSSDQAVDGWLAETRCWVRFRVEAPRSLRMEDLRLIDANAIETMGESEWAAVVTERVVRPIADILLEPTDLPSLGAMLRSKISAKVYAHPSLRDVLQLDNAADPDT